MKTALPRAPHPPKARTGRLILEIAGTSYALRFVPCDKTFGVRAFRLKKEDGTSYDVVETRYGPECDCADFVFRREGLDPNGCKHVQALVSVGMIARPLAT